MRTTDERGKRSQRTVVTWLAIAAVASVMWIAAIAFWPRRATTGANVWRDSSSRTKMLALGCHMYAADNDGRLPVADAWMDATLPYSKFRTQDKVRLFKSPLLVEPKKDDFGYAFFEPVSTLVIADVLDPATVPLIFESTDLSWNAHGDMSKRALWYKGESGNVAFLDGRRKRKEKSWPAGPITIVIKKNQGGGDDD